MSSFSDRNRNMYLESAGAVKRQRIDSLAESNITLPSTGAISALPVDSTMFRDLYSANVLAQCRGEGIYSTF